MEKKMWCGFCHLRIALAERFAMVSRGETMMNLHNREREDCLAKYLRKRASEIDYLTPEKRVFVIRSNL